MVSLPVTVVLCYQCSDVLLHVFRDKRALFWSSVCSSVLFDACFIVSTVSLF